MELMQYTLAMDFCQNLEILQKLVMKMVLYSLDRHLMLCIKWFVFFLNLIIFLTYFILNLSFYKGNKTEARKSATEAGEIKLFLFFRN